MLNKDVDPLLARELCPYVGLNVSFWWDDGLSLCVSKNS